jgi:hypothetical protein
MRIAVVTFDARDSNINGGYVFGPRYFADHLVNEGHEVDAISIVTKHKMPEADDSAAALFKQVRLKDWYADRYDFVVVGYPMSAGMRKSDRLSGKFLRSLERTPYCVLVQDEHELGESNVVDNVGELMADAKFVIYIADELIDAWQSKFLYTNTSYVMPMFPAKPSSHGMKPNGIGLGYVGRIVSRKKIRQFLQVADQFAPAGIHGILCDGPFKVWCLKQKLFNDLYQGPNGTDLSVIAQYRFLWCCVVLERGAAFSPRVELAPINALAHRTIPILVKQSTPKCIHRIVPCVDWSIVGSRSTSEKAKAHHIKRVIEMTPVVDCQEVIDAIYDEMFNTQFTRVIRAF